MGKNGNCASEGNAMSDKKNTKIIIKSLIADLASDNGVVRVKARRQLVAYKARSVAPLVKALSNKSDYVRWEAAKALSQIGNPASIQALLRALEDNMFDVRWLAAEGLIRIGPKAVVPMLETLVEHSDSYWLREGSHHVMHDMNKGKLMEVLRPVLVALESNEPSLTVPLAARVALDTLTKKV
jgi:HEAT repeat protein